MLTIKSLDAIRINADFEKSNWNLLTGQLEDLARHHKEKMKVVASKVGSKTNGVTVTICPSGHRLQISVLQCMKSRWVAYSFGGIVPVQAFQDATVLLGEFSFANALNSNRVKRLELAIDYVNRRSSEIISHRKGVRTSRVISNDLGTGITQYSGSSESCTQLVVYDKAQEILDKGKVPPLPEMLRIELRFQNREVPLLDLVTELLNDDPWKGVYLVDKKAALLHVTAITAWPLFLSVCSELGVARALQHFPKHKKTFLTALKVPALQIRIPTMQDFEGPLKKLLEQLSSVKI